MPSEHLNYAEEHLLIHDTLTKLNGDILCGTQTTSLYYAAFHCIHELAFTKHGIALSPRHVDMMKEIDPKRADCLFQLPRAIYAAFRDMKNASERSRYGCDLQVGATRAALLKADYAETARNFGIVRNYMVAKGVLQKIVS